MRMYVYVCVCMVACGGLGLESWDCSQLEAVVECQSQHTT